MKCFASPDELNERRPEAVAKAQRDRPPKIVVRARGSQTSPAAEPRPGPITATHVRGLPGLRLAARDVILAAQPTTVLEALRIPGVGRTTTGHLLELGLLADPEGVQERTIEEASRALGRRL